MYCILFGGEAKITFAQEKAADFIASVAICEGIQALQKTTESSTISYRIDAQDWPEGVERNFTALAAFLTT